MINHARTLLLNRPGATRPLPTYFLEEYVDPAFTPLQLPGALATVRNVLIGDGSDDAYANFRLWQLLRLVHSTEYAHYITDLDPRVTYLRRRSVVDAGAVSSYTPLTGPTTPKLYLLGSLETPLLPQRLQYDWLVEVVSGLVVRSTLIQTQQTTDTIVTVDDDLSSPIPLAGQGTFNVRIASNAPLPVGARWQVTAFAKPAGDPSLLLEPLAKIGDEALFELFGNAEPYKTFSDLFTKHVYFQYRLTGMVLAYAYKANEVRSNGG